MLRHQSGQADGGADGREREQQRDAGGDDRAEGQQQDDQRDGQAELLRLLEVVADLAVDRLVHRGVADLGDGQVRMRLRDGGRRRLDAVDALGGGVLGCRSGRLPDVQLHRHHGRTPVAGADEAADVGDRWQGPEPLLEVCDDVACLACRELLALRCLDQHPLGEVGGVARLLDGPVGAAGRADARLAVGQHLRAGGTAADDGCRDEQQPDHQRLPAMADAPVGQAFRGPDAAAIAGRGRGSGVLRGDDGHDGLPRAGRR